MYFNKLAKAVEQTSFQTHTRAQAISTTGSSPLWLKIVTLISAQHSDRVLEMTQMEE